MALRAGRGPDRQPPERDRFLSIEEFQLLLAGCKDPELRTVILVLCMTTLRLRELLNRRWAEIHLEGPAPYIARVLLSDTSTDTPAPGEKSEEDDGPETLIPEGDVGGVDGTRTRDLRRDRPAF